MKRKISISDFEFQFVGYGMYKVTYCSPATGKMFTKVTNNMVLIDQTKNSDSPKVNDLNFLKSFCKNK
jgi:hypothetical protein